MPTPWKRQCKLIWIVSIYRSRHSHYLGHTFLPGRSVAGPRGPRIRSTTDRPCLHTSMFSVAFGDPVQPSLSQSVPKSSSSGLAYLFQQSCQWSIVRRGRIRSIIVSLVRLPHSSMDRDTWTGFISQSASHVSAHTVRLILPEHRACEKVDRMIKDHAYGHTAARYGAGRINILKAVASHHKLLCAATGLVVSWKLSLHLKF